MKCASYIPALREASSRTVQKRASPGERIMASLFPSRGTGWPGGWSQDRLEQVLHYRQWTFVAIDLICSKIASITPNLAYVVDAPKPGITQKACRRSPGYFGQGQWISDGGHSFLTMGAYRSKALSGVKPHEELEPLESDHRLRELVDNPNPVDTSFDLLYELQMFDELCGVDYLWAVPNRWGMPAELWVIPSHWVWPRTGGGRIPDGGLSHVNHRLMEPQWDPGQEVGDHVRYGTQYVNPNMAHADELIHYYEVRPWGGMGSAGILRLPPNEVIMTRWKSPINKIDGYSKLAAAAQWIDSEESITKSRWSQFQNVARPEFWIELGPGYEDPDDDRIARTEAKIASKIQGEYNYGKPLITPPGSKVTPLSFNPGQMAYQESEEQIRDMILSTFRVPPSAVGIVKEMTYGSILATLGALCTFCLNPRLVMRGQALTKHLASKWDSDQTPAWSNGASKKIDSQVNGAVNGVPYNTVIDSRQTADIKYKYLTSGQGGRSSRRKVRLWWDDCVPADPSQVNSDIAEDRAHYAITPDEVRAIRGRHPYKFWGSDPIAQGPAGVMPLPLNTGRDLTKYAELLKPITEQQQQAEGGPGQGGEQGAAVEGEGQEQENPLAALLGGNQVGSGGEEGPGQSEGGGEEGLQPEEGGQEAEQPEESEPETPEGGQEGGEGFRPINRLSAAATPPKRPNGPPSKLLHAVVTKNGSHEGEQCKPGWSASRTGCTPKKPTSAKPQAGSTAQQTGSEKPTVSDVYNAVQQLRDDPGKVTDNTSEQLRSIMTKLPINDLIDLKNRLGVTAYGNAANMANMIVNALDLKPTAAPKPVSTPAKPGGAPVKPISAPAKPTGTPTKPTGTPAKPQPISTSKLDSDIADIDKPDRYGLRPHVRQLFEMMRDRNPGLEWPDFWDYLQQLEKRGKATLQIIGGHFSPAAFSGYKPEDFPTHPTGRGKVAWVILSPPSKSVTRDVVNDTTKALDPQGGEEPVVPLDALRKADFITLSKEIDGTNCSSCLFNTDGVCQHSIIKGQPVNERNCCAFWDSPDTLREWKRKGLI